MSITPGQFNETLLQDLRIQAKQVQADALLKKDTTPFLDTIDFLNRIHNKNINVLFSDSLKDRDVELIYPHGCGIDVSDEVTDCTPSGCTQLSTNKKTLTLTEEMESCFVVSEAQMRTNEFTAMDLILEGVERVQKESADALSQYAIGVLNTLKGVNQYPVAPGDVVANDTYIAPADWNSRLYAYFQMVKKTNKFFDPAILTGSKLGTEMITAMFNGGNPAMAGNISAFMSIPTFVDYSNLTTVNTPLDITYLVDKHSIAVASKKVYDETIKTWGGQYTTYSFRNKYMPELWHNVMITETCSNNQQYYNYKIFSYYDVLGTATGCTANNTGILTFICGVSDAS